MTGSDGHLSGVAPVPPSSSTGLPMVGSPEGDPVAPEWPGDTNAELTFEQIMGALEAVTRRMSSADVGIEEATDLYEEAERLHALATDRLARIQARIDSLAAPRQSL